MFPQLVVALLLPVLSLSQGTSLKPYNNTALAMFYISDVNKDGILTLAETQQNFKSYDTNNNGLVTRYEYIRYVDTHSPQLHALAHGLYDIYDVDNDEVLELHDYVNFHKLMDCDGDGGLVAQEYVRYMVILLEALEYLHDGSYQP